MNGNVAGHGHGDQPDSDAIKMFIGQIPKVWGELEVREMLEAYGHIYQLNILREKGSVISKGCCFVTFYTRKAALDAQNDLHNMKTLPGMHHCVQMKPADSENKSEDRKLFVGMISKKLAEQDLRLMFSPFGTIEECRVLVNSDGISKGCAFITYTNKVSAQNAIRSMHQSSTMEGCSAPIVVKIADSPKDKERKKVQSQLAQQLNQLTNQWKNIAALAPMLQTLSLHNNNNTTQFPTPSSNNQAQSQQALALAAAAAQIILNQQQQPTSPTSNGFHNSSQGVSNVRNLTTPPWNNQTSMYQTSNASNGITSTSPFDHISLGGSNYETSSTGISSSNMLSSLVPGSQALYNQPMVAQSTSPAGSHREGPEGSNLFIYHLPAQFSDHDLMQAFMSFGSVVSAKVFIDKQTNLSKCFGFVSYDNPMSAQHAIQTMHGYQIGMKRLKVQLKRSKSDCKSY